MSALWPGQGYITAPPAPDFQEKKTRNLAILGSTGSIGRNALSVVEQSPGSFRVMSLSCRSNVELLAAQASQHRPPLLAVHDKTHADKLKSLLPEGYGPQILTGPAGYAAIASQPDVDCVLSAQVGAAGLAGTLGAALAGKVIALANKESLVLAGGLLRKICAKSGAAILPVDSEHHALFQCLSGRPQDARRLVLTASGGPFRGKSAAFARSATSADALKHPSWSMGAKITIDSATLINKGLEIIEAACLYGFPPKDIQVLVHPQSIVHSMVEFKDNSMLAQMAAPDMRLPIAACLLWPRCRESFVKPLNLAEVGSLTFENVNEDVFKGVMLARMALAYMPSPRWREWGMNPACIALNGANEMAVELFLDGKCGFAQICEIVGDAMRELVLQKEPAPPPLPEMGADIVKNALALAGGIAELDEKARNLARELALAKKMD